MVIAAMGTVTPPPGQRPLGRGASSRGLRVLRSGVQTGMEVFKPGPSKRSWPSSPWMVIATLYPKMPSDHRNKRSRGKTMIPGGQPYAALSSC